MNPLLDANARLVIGHRGNRVSAPENSLAGLREAVALGADAVEFDVRATRDGVVVLMHDESLDRTTTSAGLVRAHTYAELGSVRIRPPGSVGDSAPVPTLEEVLDALRGVPLVIEIKELAAADGTLSLIERFGLKDLVVVGSAEADVAQRLYRSAVAACASMADAMRAIPRALVGLPLAARGYDVLSLTPRFHGMPVPVRRIARVARRQGIPTQVWTVNDPDVARAYWNSGVGGIITDHPAAILRSR